jgi:hypothetical protein
MTALVMTPVLVERSVVPMAVELGVPHLDILEDYHCSLSQNYVLFALTPICFVRGSYLIYITSLTVNGVRTHTFSGCLSKIIN